MNDVATERRSDDRWGLALFAGVLIVYLATRLIAIDWFPIFFHADEAFGPLTAAELLRNGLHDASHRLLPVYFEPAPNRWMPIGTVYAHLLPVALWGTRIAVTRTTTALVTVAGAAAVALTLRDEFGARRWWSGTLILGAMPAWFIHSRTGFETAMMTAMFAVFVWCYLRYRRVGGGVWACAAVVAGAATFYAYSNGQPLMATLALLMGLVDARHHWQQRRALLPALVVALLLAVPFVHFHLVHPGVELEHLHAIDSYLVDPARSTGQKAIGFAQRYAFGLHPRFWFISHDVDNSLAPLEGRWPWLTPALMLGNQLDIQRHRYRGWGHIALWMLPFFAVGLVGALRRWRLPPHRTVLLAALAVPVGAATAGIGITRVMAFLVPAALLTALGLETVLDVVERRLVRANSRMPWARVVTVAAFGALAAANVGLLVTALRTGPYWYDDYGLYGMQWGAPQLFGEVVPELLASDKDVQVMMTSDWANAANRLPHFFLTPTQMKRVRSRGVSELLLRKIDLSDDLVWVVTDHELEGIRASGKFVAPEMLRTLDWPDGRPGFHAIRLHYVPGVDAVFAAERAARRRLVDATVDIDGHTVTVRHSLADMGKAADMFDDNRSTLLRGMEANPLIVELIFSTPHVVNGLVGDFAHMPFTWTIELFAPGASEPVVYRQSYRQVPTGDVRGEAVFDRGPSSVAYLRMMVHQDDQDDEVHIHVRELTLR